MLSQGIKVYIHAETKEFASQHYHLHIENNLVSVKYKFNLSRFVNVANFYQFYTFAYF